LIQKKTKFEKRLGDLHQSAERINGGLKEVLELLDGVSLSSASFLEKPEKSNKEDLYAGNIYKVVDVIRAQVEEIVKISHEFAEHITQHGSEISDLSEQLEKTKKDAMIDPLTGVANRRKFEIVLDALLGDIQKLKGRLSVLVSDVDDFKEINDKLGHHAGDQVLRLVAKSFIYNLKDSDFVCRWGGDEFTAIIPNATPINAAAVGERIRSTLAKKTIMDKESGETLGKVTLSIGVSSYRDGDTSKKMTDRADKAMYVAKHSGKNKVVTDKD